MIVFVCGIFEDTLRPEEAARAHRVGKKVCSIFGRHGTTIYFTPCSASDAAIAVQIMLAMRRHPNAYADEHLKSDIFVPDSWRVMNIATWLRQKQNAICVVSPDFVTLSLSLIVEELIPGYRGVTELSPLEAIRLDVAHQCGRKIR